MTEPAWLTKAEVNSHFYNTVGGEVFFATEGQLEVYPTAVAKLVAGHAASLGKREIRILELGANNCAFARTLLELLKQLRSTGGAPLDRVDYLAVEFAPDSLEAALRRESDAGTFDKILLPAVQGPVTTDQSSLLAVLVDHGPPRINLGLVHAEANQFVARSGERFDFVILNELLDDLPSRIFYADEADSRYELSVQARLDGSTWQVRISESELSDDAGYSDMPRSTMTATSEESLTLVKGITGLLESGGLLLVHDYGFTKRYVGTRQYEKTQIGLPRFVRMEFPEGSGPRFPTALFRVFGNETLEVIQITNDINFAELETVLERSGMVITLPHGNALVNNRRPGGLSRGDGVFLSEFGLLNSRDDLPKLLARLHRTKQELHDRYVRLHMNGEESVFTELIYVKG